METPCKERSRLADAVRMALQASYKAMVEQDRARKKKLDMTPFADEVLNARANERAAIAALQKHRNEHGC
jgi:hypothetical protein